jgi:hypothetical protein
MKISNQKFLVAPVMLTAIVGSMLPTHAQRERPSREERQDQRQQRRQQMTPEQRQQQWQQRMQNMTPEQRQRMQQRFQERMQNMTPEQREQAQQAVQNGDFGALQGMMGGGRGGQGGQGMGGQNAASREERQRQLMTNAGITDQATQDAIVAFVAAQEVARRPLLEMARNLSLTLNNPNATAEQTTTGLAAFREASVADQTRYETALKELDTQIRYSTNPKVETFLTLIGVLGNEVAPLGGPNVVFAQGGRGQGEGRGQGWRNRQGGNAVPGNDGGNE